MPSTLIKVSAGIAGATAVGGGATAIYLVNNNTKAVKQTNIAPSNTKTITKNKAIDSLLNKKRLLTEASEDEGKWVAPWQAFKAAYTSDAPTEPWDFESWTADGEDVANLASFKKQCVSLGGQKVSGKDDPIYIAVEKYCTTSTEDTGNA